MTSQLRGTIHLPADKSIAHRALLLAAMGYGTATITIYRPGADVRSTAAAMASLGLATISDDGATMRVEITGGGTPAAAGLPGSDEVTLDCGNSGTLMRLLAGAATTRPGRTILIGDESLSIRPMERVAAPLREMGADVSTSAGGLPPVIIDGTATLAAGRHALPVASAQVLGAIILAALPVPGITEIEVPGPTRDHTERMLSWLGVDIARDGLVTRLTGPAAWAARDLEVPADPSGAAFWLVAGAIHPDAQIRLAGVGLNPTRLGVVRILERMGARIASQRSLLAGPEPAGDLIVHTAPSGLQAIDLTAADVADVIDELPVLAIAMAAAEGVSTVSGAGELRVKESDRIALVVAGLQAIGVDATETPDGWRIVGRPPRGATAQEPTDALIRTAGDHRITMAFAIADLVRVGERGCTVDDPECAAVSYPSFWTDLGSLQ